MNKRLTAKYLKEMEEKYVTAKDTSECQLSQTTKANAIATTQTPSIPSEMNTTHEIVAASLRRMAEWYGQHPTPGAITPLDAIQAVLWDVAIASEKATKGLVWKAKNEWEPIDTTTPQPPPPITDYRLSVLKERMDSIKEHLDCKAAGFAGVYRGMICDRRDHPDAIPMQKNSLLSIPEPTRCHRQECRSLRLVWDSQTEATTQIVCKDCGALQPTQQTTQQDERPTE